MRFVVCACLLVMVFTVLSFASNPPPDHEIPSALLYIHSGLYSEPFGRPSDTLRGEIRKYYFTKKLNITWNFRPSDQYKFKSNDQDLFTPYTILGIWAPNQTNLYLAGVTDDGETVIERWRFDHPSIKIEQPASGGEVSFSRELPQVKKTELYKGDELTHVCNIYGDPQGRYILLFTWEEKTICQMDIETGDMKILFDPDDELRIEDFRTINSFTDRNGRYVFSLSRYPKGVNTYSGFKAVERGSVTHFVTDAVIFCDADRDGTIETDSLSYLTEQDWIDTFLPE